MLFGQVFKALDVGVCEEANRAVPSTLFALATRPSTTESHTGVAALVFSAERDAGADDLAGGAL